MARAAVAGAGPDDLARLRRDHLELRLAIEVLAQAAAGGSTLTPQQVAAYTRDLLTQLQTHLAAEEAVLFVTGAESLPTTSLGSRPHEWYPLTEGPVIDLDRLPGAPGIDAVLERLLRMSPDEQVQLHASSDPGPIWAQLSRIAPGGYSCTIVQETAGQWRVDLTRRNI